MPAKTLRWLALVLPLLLLAGGIVRGERAIRSGETWHFEVGGYDPRDLLRGRYLRFRIVEQWGDPHDLDQASPAADCACLERTDGKSPPILHAASCSFARAECDDFVVLADLQSIDRFYIPEDQAKDLERRLQEAAARNAARAVIVINPNGTPVLVDLEVDGAPLRESRSR